MTNIGRLVLIALLVLAAAVAALAGDPPHGGTAIKLECDPNDPTKPKSIPDDSLTRVNEAEWYKCLVLVFKNCFDSGLDLDAPSVGINEHAAADAFSRGCVYFQSRPAWRAGHGAGSGEEPWSGYVEWREDPDDNPMVLIPPVIVSPSEPKADTDWSKKFTIVHEAAHLVQSRYLRLTDSIRMSWFDSNTWPPSVATLIALEAALEHYLEILAAVEAIRAMEYRYEQMAPAKRPSAERRAEELARELDYMRSSATAMCATWIVQALGGGAGQTPTVYWEQLKPCKDLARDYWSTWTVALPLIHPEHTLPDWPAETEEE